MHRVSEATIKELMAELKAVPHGLTPLVWAGQRNGHKFKNFEIIGEAGSSFVIKVRQSSVNAMSFSVILGYVLPGSYTVFRLRRYNGRHEHRNVLENVRLDDFHIHQATERYQEAGLREDAFAVVSTDFHDVHSAIARLIEECGFRQGWEDTPLFASRGK